MRKFLASVLLLSVPVCASLWCRATAVAAAEARVALRPLQQGDRAALLEILQHPRAEKLSGDRYEDYHVDSMIAAQSKVNWSERTFVVVDDHTGRPIGMVGVEKRSDGEVGLSYSFHPDVWGQGYATEAVDLLIPRIFSEMGMDCIRATAKSRNEPSWRLLERVGFTRTKTIEVGPARAPEEYFVYELKR